MSAWLHGCSALSPAYDFSAEISECQSRNDVNIILKGKFGKVREEFTKFENIRAEVDDGQKPKLIYHFKVDRLLFGSTGITDNRTGKQSAPQFMEIRAGEAPQDALGKNAVICYGGKPSKIRTIYFAK